LTALNEEETMQGYFKRVHEQTQSRFWINNVTLEEARLALEAGAVGCTQNPSYVYKMLSSADEHDRVEAMLARSVKTCADDGDVQIEVQRELVASIAKQFLPLYESSHGRLGYVSIQGDPFREDYESIVRLARFNREAGPNVMIKIPVTEHGLHAIVQCLSEGMPINATEVMSVSQAIAVCDAYDRAAATMAHPPVAYLSHIAGIFDEYLAAYAQRIGASLPSDYLFQAGKIVAKKIRAYMDQRKTAVGFINGGARGLHHFTEWVGADISTTINWKGTAEDLVRTNPPVVARFDNPVPESVLEALLRTLPDFERAYFADYLPEHEWEEFGPVVLFCSSFKKAWGSTAERIAAIRLAKH
jgi:transaldolase